MPAELSINGIPGFSSPGDLSDSDAELIAPAEKTGTVLIVEDNPGVRAYLNLHLSTYYHLHEAENGQLGLEKARQIKPDLIISDIMMPEMDGFKLCQTLKEDPEMNHIPIILLTALAGEAEKMEGLGTGADDYISKPFNAEELQLRVENLIEIRRRLRKRFSKEFHSVREDRVLSPEDAGFAEQVRNFIEAELSNSSLTTEQIADSVNLSLRQLHRRLKSTIDLTPAGYVRLIRLENAANLLKNDTDQNVAEIARLVGFMDPNYFSKAFKAAYNLSPNQYRIALRDKKEPSHQKEMTKKGMTRDD